MLYLDAGSINAYFYLNVQINWIITQTLTTVTSKNEYFLKNFPVDSLAFVGFFFVSVFLFYIYKTGNRYTGQRLHNTLNADTKFTFAN